MTAWLLRLIGVSETVTSGLAQAKLLWTRPILLAAGLVLLVPVAVLVVRRHNAGLAHVGLVPRRILSACRIGVLLLLVIVVGGPYLRREQSVTDKPALLFVLDDSASMGLPAGPFSPAAGGKAAAAAALPASGEAQMRKQLNAMSRAELVARALSNNEARVLAPLRERFDVRAYAAARSARKTRFPPPRDAGARPSDAGDTDLGGALEQAIEDAAGRQVAGIILVSDGRNTTGPDPLRVLRRYNGTDGASADTPLRLWAIPAGGDQAPPDIAVLEALAPSSVTEGDHAAVVATVLSSGFAGRTVKVRLLDAGLTCDEADLTLADDQRQQVQLTFDAEGSGVKVLTVRVEPQTEEQVKANNEMSAFLDVDEQRRKLLYIEGGPRWDFRFLDHALRRDHGLDVTLVMECMRSAPPGVPPAAPTGGVAAADAATGAVAVAKAPAPAAPPATNAPAVALPQDAAGYAAYHAVLLGDVSPALLPARAQEQLLKAVVEEGVGLIVAAGPMHLPAAFAGGPLADRLPAAPDPESPRGYACPAYAPFQMKLTAAGALHPAFQLYDSASRNREVWGCMPPFFWAAGVRDERPGATVLASVEFEGVARPLVAEQMAGRGRVLFLGTDETFRWRRNIGEHLFYRFWGQAIRYVARSAGREGGKSWLEVSPRRAEPGDSVSVTLFSVESDGSPVRAPRLAARIATEKGEEPLSLDPTTTPGLYRGTWAPPEVGVFRIEYADAAGKPLRAFVQAAGSGKELSRPDVDRDFLGTLADSTGGGVVELSEIASLPERLKGQPVTRTVVYEDELWDNWLTLVLLVGFYCTDVGLRRMLGLV